MARGGSGTVISSHLLALQAVEGGCSSWAARSWSLGCRALVLKGCPLLTDARCTAQPGDGRSARALPCPGGHPPVSVQLRRGTRCSHLLQLPGWKARQLQAHPGSSHQHPPPSKSTQGLQGPWVNSSLHKGSVKWHSEAPPVMVNPWDVPGCP